MARRTGFSAAGRPAACTRPSSCLRAGAGHDDEFELVHASSFPLNDDHDPRDDSTSSRRGRARSASTIARKPIHARVELVVDDDVVVLGDGARPPARAVAAAAGSPLRCPCCGRAAAARAPRTTAAARRCRSMSAPCGAHLPGALDVDDEHHVAPAGELALGVGRAGAVEVAEDVGPLQERVRRDHRLEPLAGDEIIVHAVGFPVPRRRATCRTATCSDPGITCDQPLDERRLAGARRRRDDEQQPAPAATRHSGPARASSRAPPSRDDRAPSTRSPSAFEPIVFTSRFISCSRKSSLRPHGSGASASARQCARWARNRALPR